MEEVFQFHLPCDNSMTAVDPSPEKWEVARAYASGIMAMCKPKPDCFNKCAIAVIVRSRTWNDFMERVSAPAFSSTSPSPQAQPRG